MGKKKTPIERIYNLKERFSYWFDSKMTKGSLDLIKFLIIISIVFALIIAGLIILFKYNEAGQNAPVYWNSVAGLLNSSIPTFDEGSLGYIILMSLSGIAGILFTSVLIGIITSTIEEKIDSLKRGNSLVIEKGHTVILGFYPGEYTLLEQLILASSGKPECVVIAEDMDRLDMEDNIRENLDIPKKFKIVCRSVDITDPASIEKCSVDTCKTIIVSPTDDLRTIKAVLAVTTLLEQKGASEINVNAIISREEYRFPPSIAEANNITNLQTNAVLAKMIAHSCTQTGLSETFREIFNFKGCEFYLIEQKGIDGLSFEDLLLRMDNGTPAGVFRDEKLVMNPPADYLLKETDRILVFSEEIDSAKLTEEVPLTQISPSSLPMEAEESTETIIIGSNETLPVFLQGLPENVSCAYLVGQDFAPEERDMLEEIAKKRNLKLVYKEDDPKARETLMGLAKTAEHIVILNDHSLDPEEADMEVIFLLMHLRDIRLRNGFSYNITVEMQREHNQKLMGIGDHTDFLVASSMSSLILAQLAESPDLVSVFHELLSNEGNELYLKNAGLLQLEGSYSVRELRQQLFKRGYILIGDMDADKYSTFSRKLDDTVNLSKEDCLIVIGEK